MARTRTAASKDVQSSWSRTDIKLQELRHTWTINNFSYCQEENGKALESPSFGTVNGPKWVIKLYPRGNSEIVKDYVSLFLYLAALDEDGPKLAEVKYRFTFLNLKHEPIYNNNTESSYWKFDTPGRGRGYTQFIHRNELSALMMREDHLVVCCKLVIRGDRVDTSCEVNASDAEQNIPTPQSELSFDFGKMFSSQKYGDIIVEAEGKELLAYKGILQARSPVFAAMFSHEMQEQRQSRIVIADAEYRIVEEMLTFMHTGKSPNLQDMAKDVLPLADRYNVDRWKAMAEEVLSTKLTKENAVETVILADLYNANHLKTSVINFILANCAYFLGETVWANIVEVLCEHPNVMNDVTRALFSFAELI